MRLYSVPNTQIEGTCHLNVFIKNHYPQFVCPLRSLDIPEFSINTRRVCKCLPPTFHPHLSHEQASVQTGAYFYSVSAIRWINDTQSRGNIAYLVDCSLHSMLCLHKKNVILVTHIHAWYPYHADSPPELRLYLYCCRHNNNVYRAHGLIAVQGDFKMGFAFTWITLMYRLLLATLFLPPVR